MDKDTLQMLNDEQYVKSQEHQQAMLEHALQCSVTKMVKMVGERQTRRHVEAILESASCPL